MTNNDISIAKLYSKRKLLKSAMEKGLTKKQALEWRKQFLEEEKKRVPNIQEFLNNIFKG